MWSFVNGDGAGGGVRRGEKSQPATLIPFFLALILR